MGTYFFFIFAQTLRNVVATNVARWYQRVVR